MSATDLERAFFSWLLGWMPAFALIIIACAPTPPPRGSLYPPHRATAAECDAAQVTLDRLDCRQRTHAGRPFADLCRIAAADSPARDWRPDCIMLVTSCDQVGAAYAVPSTEKCR
jgi:hypothetical protein